MVCLTEAKQIPSWAYSKAVVSKVPLYLEENGSENAERLINIIINMFIFILQFLMNETTLVSTIWNCRKYVRIIQLIFVI